MALSIHQLRKNGFEVHVNHFWYIGDPSESHNLASYHHIRAEKLQNKIKAKGGLTSVKVNNGQTEFYVEAKCSNKDAFNRKIALQVCLGRLEKQLSAISLEKQLLATTIG